MHIFAYAPVEFNCLKAIAKTFILLPDKSSSLKKTFWTMLQFAGLPLQWIQTFPSLDRTLRIHYINSNLISHQLKFSKVVNQSSNLMLLISVADMLRQWKQWTFKMISPLFALTTSETTVHWNLIWLQCQMVLRFVLVNSWRITETGALLYYLWSTLPNSLYWENETHRLQLTSLVLLDRLSKMDFPLQQIFNHISPL